MSSAPPGRFLRLGLLFACLVGPLILFLSPPRAVVAAAASIEATAPEAEAVPEAAEPVFRLVKAQSSRSSSAAHCSINVLTTAAWKTNACWYTNLCYDVARRDFVFFNELEGARLPLPVSVDHKTEFTPRIERAPLPLPRLEPVLADEVFIPFQPQRARLEDAVRDEVFALWLLAANSPWESYSGVQPIALGGSASPAAAWMRALLDSEPMALDALAASEGAQHVCFPRAAMGLGAFTDHCDVDAHHVVKKDNSRRHGFKEPRFPCAFGRGPLFWRMRLDMLAALGVADAAADDVLDVVINTADDSSLWAQLRDRLPSSVPVRLVNLAALSLAEQARVVARANVLVTPNVGAGSASAHFLPRNTALVLVCASEAQDNFGYFGGLGFVRPFYHVGAGRLDELARLVAFEHGASQRMRRTV